MNTTITVRIANNYGQRAIAQIKGLGYTIAVEQQAL